MLSSSSPVVKGLLGLAFAALLAVPTQAQLHGTVGPDNAPIGCPISITLSNDQPGSFGAVGCPYRVFDDQMNLVYDPGATSPCGTSPVLMGPWGWVNRHWDQRDDQGLQVPPGLYFVEVRYEFGDPTLHRVRIGGGGADLVLEGRATIHKTITGQARNFYLCSPQDAGRTYVLLASFTADTGIPTCAGPFPLDPDLLFTQSLGGSFPFQGAIGTLGGNGTTEAPTFKMPESPDLVGISLVSAFAVLDLGAPCFVRRISGTHRMTIVG